MKKWSYLLIAIAAAFWGVIALFVYVLRENGLSSIQIVAVRVITAGLWLLVYVALKDRSLLRIKPCDLKYFIGTGVLSIIFFNWCYFTAIEEISLSMAVVLLYTAPAFVTVISRFVFKEKLTPRKIGALGLMLVGSALVVGLLPALKVTISLYGLAVGLGAGFGYALYSIFGKMASSKYSSLTITTYTFLVASVAIIPISRLWEVQEILLQGRVVVYSLGLGLIPTSLAYLLYTIGLANVETSRAAVVANIEPVVALLVGIGFFGDILSVWQGIGSILVLAAVVIVQETQLPAFLAGFKK